MKGQDVMTSNVACHALLLTENSNEHPKTRDQQKHEIFRFVKFTKNMGLPAI